ncbi:hypothetical protein CRYUN_Cryun09bG0016500 [Craigia yunnanensis]
MASSSNTTIQHFTHCHPLTKLSANKEFLCHGCGILGDGTRYRCEPCDFDLHDHCGTCPMELSSFMHEHGLKLVLHKLQDTRQNDRVCDLCGDTVERLVYRCNLCEFVVHPLCTQLPQYVRHVMHKDHPLRLQGSVPGRCMVCKDTCESWHYRCGICCFDLHLECVLSPCEEATTTSTPRSLTTPAPPPSASPFFGYGAIPPPTYHAYGYGATPPPPPYGYGATPPPHHAYGYGAIPPPPPYGYGATPPPHHAYGYGATPPPPYGYGAIPPPTTYFGYASGVPFVSPYFGPYAHGHGIPYSPGVSNVNSQHTNTSQVHASGGKFRKKMYAIIGSLTLGVLSNGVAEAIF